MLRPRLRFDPGRGCRTGFRDCIGIECLGRLPFDEFVDSFVDVVGEVDDLSIICAEVGVGFDIHHLITAIGLIVIRVGCVGFVLD